MFSNLEEINSTISAKLVEPETLRERNFTLAFTNGCFDLVHVGHLHVLKFAKATADKLVVAVNSDASVRGLKGPTRPIITLPHRMELLASLAFVDFVVSFEEPTPYEVMQKIRPDTLIKGEPYKADEVVGRDLVKHVFICPALPGLSTTHIVSRTRNC